MLVFSDPSVDPFELCPSRIPFQVADHGFNEVRAHIKLAGHFLDDALVIIGAPLEQACQKILFFFGDWGCLEIPFEISRGE